jgi:hypothetical protein
MLIIASEFVTSADTISPILLVFLIVISLMLIAFVILMCALSLTTLDIRERLEEEKRCELEIFK